MIIFRRMLLCLGDSRKKRTQVSELKVDVLKILSSQQLHPLNMQDIMWKLKEQGKNPTWGDLQEALHELVRQDPRVRCMGTWSYWLDGD